MNQPPTWAGRSVPAGDSPPPEEGRKGSLLPIVGAAALVLLIGVAGFALGRNNNGDDSDDATATTAEVTTTSASAISATTNSDETTETAETTQPDETAETTTPDETTVSETTAAPDEASQAAAEAASAIERRAVLKGGKLYLRGAIPSAEIGAAIVARAAAVVGPDNVVNEYVVVETSSFPESAPLYVEDLVLFAFGSDAINPAFVPLLELGTLLLTQNPQVTITVVSHTDSDGSEDFNMALSERRGAAVKRYWTDQGINPDQIVVDARGESSPIADNETSDGAQLNRRAEFIIANLLG